MIARSSRADVRNPAASDPDIAAAFATLPADSAQALRLALVAFTAMFRAKGAKALKARKYFMHSYWMCLAVYARHLTLAIPKAPQRALPAPEVRVAAFPPVRAGKPACTCLTNQLGPHYCERHAA